MSVSTVQVSSGLLFHKRFSQSSSWAGQHDSSSATSVDSYPPGNLTVGPYAAKGGDTSQYEIDRFTFNFNTSSIPSNATISSAVFWWYRYQEDNHQGSLSMHIVPVSETGASVGYYNKAYFGASLGNIASSAPYGSELTNINTWTSVSLTTTGIVKAGVTILGLQSNHDYANSAPDNNNLRNVFWSKNTSDGVNPYLVITWTTPAVVTTGAASSLQPISAVLAGNATDAGGGTITERGVCWSTTENPTTSNSKANSGTGTGAYSISATGLLPGTLYHYRAYVITENSTQYGADVSFRTPGGAILFNLL